MAANTDLDMEEYRALRAEIIHYLGEYQNVRNMMYVATGTLLGFGIGTSKLYLLLLPLIVIIPSYFIAIDYQKCVRVAATYLKVFYESQNAFPMKWETRKVYLDGCCFQQLSDQYILTFDRQLCPYKVCATACLVLYFGNWIVNNVFYRKDHIYLRNFLRCPIGIFDLVIGLLALFVVLLTVFKFKAVSYNTCWRAWEEILQKEQNVGLPTDAKTVISEIEHYTIKISRIQKIKWVLKEERPVDLDDREFSEFKTKSYKREQDDGA